MRLFQTYKTYCRSRNFYHVPGMVVFALLVFFASAAYASTSTIDKIDAFPVWYAIPFAGILLSIAIVPIISHDWWHKYYPDIALFWGGPVAIWVFLYRSEWLLHSAIEYASFIAMIGSLFVVCGGIFIKGKFRGTPVVNTSILALGCVLANLIGTTGASMLLVRPLIRANANRRHRVHTVVFMIFLVSNIGGSLTPLADPPLYLGLLKGVPFFWTMKLIPEWIFACGSLLIMFFAIDSFYFHRKEEVVRKGNPVRFAIDGKMNFLFLGGILGTVLLYSILPVKMGVWREALQIFILATLAFFSYRRTPEKVHIENEFSWAPIREVAILFAAIFVCMIPALKLLQMRGGELGVSSPAQFFWATGLMSGILDNAPSYLSFLTLGGAIGHEGVAAIHLADFSISETLLRSISIGAVYMGALTYIGNGPNFMVRSIAAHHGVKMPGFFGYMVWSFAILIPLFAVMTVLFFK